MIDQFYNKLAQETTCELKFDEISRIIYSIDASIYEVQPIGVALPKTQGDLQKTIQIAAGFRYPIIPRGGGTGITGGCLGEGLILDLSKYLNRILSLDLDKKEVRCEPGITQDRLNAFLAPHGYRLGPDTSTGNRATLGGMAANHAAGAHSLYYGTMVDAIKELELILSTGEKIDLYPLSFDEWQQKLSLPEHEGRIYRALEEIRINYRKQIYAHYPPLPRRASGYTLDRLIAPFPLNPAQLIIGSEGTLGVIASLTLKIVKKPSHLKMLLLGFDSMLKAMQAVPSLLKTSPSALDMVDDKILTAGLKAPSLRGKLNWLPMVPSTLLIAEFQEKAHFSEDFSFQGMIFSKWIETTEEMQNVWEVRKAGLGLLLSKRSYSRAIAFIEDIAIPPERLPFFMERFLHYLKKKGKQAGIYGHAGSGCLHIRPYIDLRSPSEVALMKEIMQDTARLVQEMGGAMSGEHGDGLIRSWLNETLFGPDIINAFSILKRAFDPFELMNPHKILDPFSVEKNLRISPLPYPSSFLSFEKEGGLSLAADLCNGNGACRKGEGVMCPSFQVTGDEYDSTRARAQTFRDVLRHPKKDLADEDLHAILDLCIQCKGCKTECPSQVDIAKMKSEALFYLQEKNGYLLRNKIFAYLDKMTERAFPFRKIYNSFAASFLGKKIFSWIGIAAPIPLFSLPAIFFFHSNSRPTSRKTRYFTQRYLHRILLSRSGASCCSRAQPFGI